MRCEDHPQREAQSFCHHCHRQLCKECLIVMGDFYFCKAAACQGAGAEQKTSVPKTFDEFHGVSHDPMLTSFWVASKSIYPEGDKRQERFFSRLAGLYGGLVTLLVLGLGIAVFALVVWGLLHGLAR